MLKSFRLLSALCIILSIMMGFGAATAQESGRQPITTENASMVTQVGALEGHTGAVNAIAFSPDGRSLASAGEDSIVRVWNVEENSGPILFEGHTSPVNSLGFSPDGTMLASGGDTSNQVFLAWDMESGEIIGQIEPQPDGASLLEWVHGGPVRILSVVFVPGGNFVFVTGEIMARFFWYTDTRDAASFNSEWNGGDPDIMSLVFSPDGTWTAIARSDALLLTPMDDEGLLQTDSSVALPCHSDVVSTVAVNSDGTKLASGSWDDTICLWSIDAENSEYTATILQGHTNDVTGVAFSPDGSLLVSSSLDGTLRLWNVETQEQLAVLTGTEGVEVRSVAFSPDGTLIASAGSDGVVRLWGVEGAAASGSTAETGQEEIIESSEGLPGAAGDPVVFLDEEAIGSLQEVFVSPINDVFGDHDAPGTTAFPSGTQTLYALLRFNPFPSGGVRIGVTVTGLDGVVDLQEKLILSGSNPGSSMVTVSYPLLPATGSYADGPYQAIVTIGDIDAIELNWSVGGE